MNIRDIFHAQQRPGAKGVGVALTATPVNTEILSPQEFLTLAGKSINNIDRIEFIPPSLGGRSLGKFKVKYLNPKLVVTK